MIKHFFNTQSKSVTGAAIIIAGAGLLSDVVGIIRDRILAHNFGDGPIMDAYFAAFKIPDLIFNLLIVGALTAGFIPTFTKLFYKNENHSQAWELANNVLNITGILLIILCGTGIIFTPFFTKIIAPGFTGQRLELTITFTRIMFLSPLFLGISMVMGGVLQSLRQFILYSIAPIFYNVGIIIGVTILTRSTLGIAGLASGVVLGAIFHSGIQIYGAYQNGFRWQWYFNLKNSDTKLIGKLMIPRTLGAAIAQINNVIVTILASLLPTGSVAIYNYANNLQSVPLGIIGIPFAIAVFPVLSKAAADNNKTVFTENVSSTMRQVLFLIIPVATITLLLRAQIVRVIYGTGVFDWNATIKTADALAFFALGLIAQTLIPLYARAFYALSNTKTPFTIGVIAELVSIIAALILMRPLGVAGLALASAIGATLNLTMLIIALKTVNVSLDGERIIKMLFRVIIAAIIMAICIQYLKYPLSKILNLNRFWGILLHGFISGSVGILVYSTICYLLKVEEMVHLQQSFKRRWLKLWNVPPGIDEVERL